ncbi:Hypothetical protein POVN_LOCUS294, partial [uncultured virus]
VVEGIRYEDDDANNPARVVSVTTLNTFAAGFVQQTIVPTQRDPEDPISAVPIRSVTVSTSGATDIHAADSAIDANINTILDVTDGFGVARYRGGEPAGTLAPFTTARFTPLTDRLTPHVTILPY